MATTELKIKVVPDFDEKQFLEMLKKAVSMAEQALKLSETITIAVESSDIEGIVNEINSIAEEDITLNADASKVVDEVNNVSNSWQKMKQDADDAYAEQFAAVAKLSAEGKQQTEEYQNALSLLRERKQVVDTIADSEKAVTNELMQQNDVPVPDANPVSTLVNIESFDKLNEFAGTVAEIGNDFAQAQKQLQAATGATAQEMSVLKDAAKDAFVNGVGESAADALKIIGQAKATVGKFYEGDELDSFVQAASNAGKAFDTDVNEVLQKSQGFIKAFDLNAADAGNLLTLAMRDGKVAAGDVLDTIQEYPLLMKSAGLNAEEFIGLMTKASAEGSFTTDKIADSIKETQIRLNAGDIDAALAGLSNVPKSLNDEILSIAKSAKQGEISVKDLMLKVTSATENAVADGSIGEQLRSQIQVAISGSPAEELGTDLYAKLFGAPIDTAAISAKAADAASIVQKSFAPDIVSKISKEIKFLQENAAAAFLPLAKGAQTITSIAPQLLALKQILPESASKSFEEGLTKIASKAKDELLPALSKLGPAFANPITIGVAASALALTYFFTQTERGQELWDKLSNGAIEFYETTKPVLNAIGDVAEEVIGFVVEDVIGQVVFVGDIISAVVSKIFDIGAALLDFFGMSSEASDLKDTVTTLESAFNNVSITIRASTEALSALREGALQILTKLLDGDITGALDAATSLGDKVGSAFNKGAESKAKELKVEALQKQVESGFEIKASLDKNNRLKELADNYSKTADAAKKQNIAETIGREFGIAADEASKFADAQEKSLTGQLQSSQKAYISLLQEQGNTYQTNKNKAEDLRKKIIEQTIAGKDVTKLTQEYNNLSKSTEDSRKVLEATVEEGKGLGITSDNLKDIALQAGLSAEEASKMAGNTKKFAQETNAAKQAARDLSAEWDKAKSSLDSAINSNVSKLSQLAIEGKKNTDEYKLLVAETRKQVQSSERMSKINEKVQKQVGLITTEHKRLSEEIQNAYDKRAASLEVEQSLFTIAVETSRLAAQRERNAGDEAALQQKTLDVLKLKKIALEEELQKRGALIKSVNGEISITAAKLNDQEKSKFINDLQSLTREIQSQSNVVLDIKIQAQIDDELFQSELRQFEREQIRAEIELGLSNPGDLASALQTEIDVVDSKIQQLRAKLIPELDAETAKQYKRQLLDLIRSRQSYERDKVAVALEAMNKEQTRIESHNAVLLRSQEQQNTLRLSSLQRALDAESRMFSKSLASRSDEQSKAIDKEAESYLASIDSSFEAQIAALDRTKEAGILSQRSYDEQKNAIIKDAEAERQRIQSDAQARRESLQEQIRQSELSYESEKQAKLLLMQAAADRELINSQIETNSKLIEIAKQRAQITGAQADQDAVVALQNTLSQLNADLESKGSSIKLLSESIGQDISQALVDGISGDDAAFEDAYRKTFGKMAGALKAYIASFVLEIVLSSPTIKAAIAATGFLAPLTTAAIYGTIYGGVNAIATPIIDNLLSFSSGGRVDQPTLAIIGDANKLGGSNREWVTNDKQLQTIVQMSASAVAAPLVAEIRALRQDFAAGIIVGELKGNDLLLVVKRAEQTYVRRLY